MPISCVYRAYDGDNQLLYIGCTNNIKHRMKSHGSWKKCVNHFHLEFFHSRERAIIEEAYAIKSENPIHNFQLNVCSIDNRGRNEKYSHYLSEIKNWSRFVLNGDSLLRNAETKVEKHKKIMADEANMTERGYIRMTKYVPAIFRHQVESFIEQKSVEWEIAEGRAE